MIPNSINLNNMPTAEHPTASDITYLMDADANKAYWAATMPLDEYTSNYIHENVKKGHTLDFFPVLYGNWDVSYSQANLYSLAAPSVTVLSDQTVGGKRKIEYQLKTNRHADELIMKSSSSMKAAQLTINGKKVKLYQKEFSKDKPLEFRYALGQAEELHVQITVNRDDHIEWMIADRSYDIPETKGKRSAKYSTYGDNSYVLKRFQD